MSIQTSSVGDRSTYHRTKQAATRSLYFSITLTFTWTTRILVFRLDVGSDFFEEAKDVRLIISNGAEAGEIGALTLERINECLTASCCGGISLSDSCSPNTAGLGDAHSISVAQSLPVFVASDLTLEILEPVSFSSKSFIILRRKQSIILKPKRQHNKSFVYFS